MMPIWTIYCHTHTESGRRYIGLTSQTMAQRWKTHVSHAKTSKGGRWYFPNAIRKYGRDAFSHEELACSKTLEYGNETEQHLIKQYETTNPEKGFNITKGGSHTPHPVILKKNPWDNPEFRMKQIAIANSPTGKAQRRANWNSKLNNSQAKAASKAALNTPKSKIKRSLIATGRRHTPEVIKKLSILNKRPCSPATRARLSEIAKRADPSIRLKISSRLKGRKIGFAIGSGTRHISTLKTHCKYGHPMHDAYIRSDGKRLCRICSYIRTKPERVILWMIHES